MPTAHWIRANEESRAPNRWVWLDTEAIEADQDGAKVQTWRLGVTAADWLNERSRRWQGPEWRRHETPGDLWDYVEGFTRPAMRTIVAAHNMGYDVRIAQAIPQLQQRGWDLVRWQVGDQGCVLRWRRADRSLWLIDSYSLLPVSIGELGSLVQLPKEELPGWDADEAEWWRRCETDVAILRAGMLHLVQWVREGDLGNWQPTAGSMAWANWRHRHYSEVVLVHDDDDAREAERAAAYTGRCEAWRHGRLPGKGWVEWDFPLAYPRVCLDTPLPTILRGRIIEPRLGLVLNDNPRQRVLSFVEVEAETPMLPARNDQRTLWPVGTFSGWYWDNELKAAVACGAKVRPKVAYRYTASYALADWAEAVIAIVEDDGSSYDAVQRLAAKAWARALIGRFGTRYWAWEDWGADDVDGVRMDWLVDFDTRQVGRMLHVAGKLFGADAMQEGANSCPAIMSAIMAECRVRLWQAMGVASWPNIGYCDTDSLIVNPAGHDALAVWVEQGGGWGMRAKSTWDRIEVVAPRQLVLDGHHRVSGVSRGAQRVARRSWVGERWEGLASAAEAGRSDRVIIRPTAWTLSGVDNRRQHLPGGVTGPFRLPAPVAPVIGPQVAP